MDWPTVPERTVPHVVVARAAVGEYRTELTELVVPRGKPGVLSLGLPVAMIVAGCGDDDPLTGAAPGDETGDDDGAADLADAMGAGGGGTLSFDGEQIVIDSVVCSFDGELFDVGTVSESGHRVLLSWTNELNPVSIQVLDADFQQWFHEGDAVYERDGTVFTSPTSTYWANGTDDTREIGFTVECP
jgi:hypothetical protein